MSKLGPISHFLSPVSCDSLVLQGLRCEWGAGVSNLVLSLSLSYWSLEVQYGTSWQRTLWGSEKKNWMNEWSIYKVLYCVFVYCCTPKALYNHVWGGGLSLLNNYQCAASTWISTLLKIVKTGALGLTQTTGWAPPAGLTNTSFSNNLVFPGGLPSRYWPGSTLT